MKYILMIFILLGTSLYGESNNQTIKHKTNSARKLRFYNLAYPPIQKVYDELLAQYNEVAEDIKTSRNPQKIEKLKKYYEVTTDEELLMALKPHPKSIALAQAAMESAWATSRFFTQANNLFGIWSTNKKEQRVSANKKRSSTRTVWVRKFQDLEDSVRIYYKTIAKNKAYREFRETRYNSDDVMEMVDKLDKYSEMGKEYTKQLRNVIRHNNLTRYDQ